MDIQSAYKEAGTLRGAAAICGTTHKTVKRILEAAAAEARAVNPAVRFYAGLATNLDGRAATSKALYQDVQDTSGDVYGNWPKCPCRGARCPSCGTPQPLVAIDLRSKMQNRPRASSAANVAPARRLARSSCAYESDVATSAAAPLAMSMVHSMSSQLWASDGKITSYAPGAKATPLRSIA